MATSKSVLTFTVLSLAAAAFAGAALWLPRRRSGRAVSPTEEPSPSDEAAPAAEPTSTTIVPFRAAALPLSVVAGPISILGTATRQFFNPTAEPAHTDMMVGPVLRADLQLAAPAALLPTFVSSCREVTFWWQSICCFVFTSSVSLTGQIVYTCVIIEISFSITGITVSVLSFIRGSGPITLMSPPACASGLLPSAPVDGAPRPELAAGLSSEGSGISDGFFSSAGSSSSLSRSTSGSSMDIEETDFTEASLECTSPIPAPAILRTAMSSPPSPTTEVDEAAEEARKREENWHRDLKQMKKKLKLVEENRQEAAEEGHGGLNHAPFYSSTAFRNLQSTVQ